MIARVGTLAVGTTFETLLTGRRGVVRAQQETEGTFVAFTQSMSTKWLHPNVRVRVVEVTH